MAIINLRDYYPFYTSDCFMEVSEEVAEMFKELTTLNCIYIIAMANKEDKERIDTIIGYLSTIARQGRAVGIHLILSMQRPDASILPGQIKNNIDCRICGRADGVLSQIVLDSTEASDAIPKDAQGRFLMADGTVFQGFWSDELDDWFLL